MGFIVGIPVHLARFCESFQRLKSVAPQQRHIPGHIVHRNVGITCKQETSALPGKLCQRLQFCLRQVFQRIKENQQVFRIRRIALFLQVLVNHLKLIGLQQVLEIGQELQLVFVVSLHDYGLRHPVLDHIRNGAGYAAFKCQVFINQFACLDVKALAYEILAADDSEPVRLLTPYDQVSFNRYRVVRGKPVNQQLVNHRIHLFPGNPVAGCGILVQQLLQFRPFPFTGLAEQRVDLHRLVQ